MGHCSPLVRDRRGERHRGCAPEGETMPAHDETSLPAGRTADDHEAPPRLSRRSMLGAAGAGVAGIAVTALAGPAMPALAATARPAGRAARGAADGDAGTAEQV